MPDCEYCSEGFEDEDVYLQHLRDEHEGELGAIDERRVAQLDAGGRSDRTRLTVLILALGSIALVGYLVTIVGGFGEDEPVGLGSVHEHGTMEVVIENESLDLNDRAFVKNDNAFHFHGDERATTGEFVWHTHATGVTLQYALGTLGIEVDDSGTELRYGGETYHDEKPGTEVRIEIDGERVEPGSYELDGVEPVDAAADGEGDDIRVVVRTDG